MTIPEGHRYEATRALRQALNRAVASELLDYNPAKQGVKNPLRRSLEKRPFDSWVETEAVATQLGPRAAQVNHLEAGLAGDDYGVCLYPLPEVLASDARISRLAKEPYRQQLAEGRGSLDLAFFKIEVLEAYRNDPTFDFRFDDSGADLVVTDEVYGVEGTSDDHISLRLGFAYGDVADDAPLVRRVCVFLSDLAKLTPVHQQRWRTYEVSDEGLRPHPLWIAQQMGEWPDGAGPFEAFLYELETWDALHQQAFGQPLLRSVERPREFGWMLRPSQLEYDGFIHMLDKLLSEDILHSALDGLGTSKVDEQGRNVGSLNRLDAFLASCRIEARGRSDQESRGTGDSLRALGSTTSSRSRLRDLR